ncbi:MAG: hypothetical protein EWM72_02544 [Nitrospira sp.]|nr:MAG: hypothetical protein EWM72_02544 [Nitrospira sp.]
MRHSRRKIQVGQLMQSVLFGFVLAMGLLVADPAGVSFADQSLPAMNVAYRDGKITSIYETTFQIDHRTFSFAPDAVILDRHGDELNASALRVDVEVKYHLLKGSTDKIDQMIVFLPE